MSDFRPQAFVSEAKNAVSAASYIPRKLALLHTGIAAAVSLVIALLTYLLDMGIGNTGGLSGIGQRAMLETAQSVLQILVMVLSPFWTLGFTAAVLRLARRQQATGSTLLSGFRRWGAALRMLLLQGVIYFVVLMIAAQIGSFLFSMTSGARQMAELIQQISAAEDIETVTDLMAHLDTDALRSMIFSMLPCILIPMAALMIPVTYRMRLASYILMDVPRCGALMAITLSFQLTKGNCLKLFRLDLHYWWYYALEVLVTVLAYGDVLLALLNVPLNVGTITASVGFYVLALGIQLGLYAWKKPQVYTTYALFYDTLLPKGQTQI